MDRSGRVTHQPPFTLTHHHEGFPREPGPILRQCEAQVLPDGGRQGRLRYACTGDDVLLHQLWGCEQLLSLQAGKPSPPGEWCAQTENAQGEAAVRHRLRLGTDDHNSAHQGCMLSRQTDGWLGPEREADHCYWRTHPLHHQVGQCIYGRGMGDVLLAGALSVPREVGDDHMVPGFQATAQGLPHPPGDASTVQEQDRRCALLSVLVRVHRLMLSRSQRLLRP